MHNEERKGKLRPTYLRPCGCECKPTRVVLADGVLRCAYCFRAYDNTSNFVYSDKFVEDLISEGTQPSDEKIKDIVVGISDSSKNQNIKDFVETHATYKQDPFVDYPSFIAYRVIWKGKEYIADSKENLVKEIVEDNP